MKRKTNDIIIVHIISNKAKKCCPAEAARIIGITAKTVYGWQKDFKLNPEKNFKEKYNYRIYFQADDIKQKKGSNKNINNLKNKI